METVDFTQKFKDGIARIRGNLVDTNIKGCFNNSIDLTRSSEFVGFDEGIFIGEVLEGIFDNFNDMLRMYDHNKAEIEPIKSEIGKLLNILEQKFPTKSEKAKAEIYDALVSARACATHLQICFFREKKLKRSPESGINE